MAPDDGDPQAISLRLGEALDLFRFPPRPLSGAQDVVCVVACRADVNNLTHLTPSAFGPTGSEPAMSAAIKQPTIAQPLNRPNSTGPMLSGTFSATLVLRDGRSGSLNTGAGPRAGGGDRADAPAEGSGRRAAHHRGQDDGRGDSRISHVGVKQALAAADRAQHQFVALVEICCSTAACAHWWETCISFAPRASPGLRRCSQVVRFVALGLSACVLVEIPPMGGNSHGL
jgi:hypothetical protein